ncbi:MAG: hypothetical protein EXX96DRAFT_647339 [Benjaminiella poitrasii]|nr:MAG: hypothetical protein EXX96DRAFT_647339 [Benjaminiella poitrasii]
MLASLPLNNSQTSATAVTSTITRTKRYCNRWPLNEIEENVMTLATCSQIKLQQQALQTSTYSGWYCSPTSVRSSAVRCDTCQRKFHSLGNLANHQQLYQH